MGPSIKDVRTFSVIFDLHPSCPHLSTFGGSPLTPALVDTNFEYGIFFDTEFFSKNPTPNVHLHHPSPIQTTRK